MKRWSVALVWLDMPPFACAQALAEAPKFGVLSLISDAYTVVTYDRGVGRLSDANLREAIPLSERVYDDVVLVAANEVLQGLARPKEIAFLSAGAATAYPRRPGCSTARASCRRNGWRRRSRSRRCRASSW